MTTPFDLLLGTRRLRRKIDAQVLLMHADIEQAHLKTEQLRQHFAARATSPLGLGIAAAAGFLVAQAGRPLRHPLQAGAAALTSMGWRLLFPVAFSWLTQTALPNLLDRFRGPAPGEQEAAPEDAG